MNMFFHKTLKTHPKCLATVAGNCQKTGFEDYEIQQRMNPNASGGRSRC